MKSILIITPYINKITPGNFRIMSFIKELKKKFQIHIINTAYSGKKEGVFYYKIEEMRFFSKSKLRNNSVFKTFFLPLLYLKWVFRVLILGSKLIHQKNIDYIFTSHRPSNVIFVGYLLKLWNMQCKLITEYRDSWTDNPYSNYPSSTMKRLMEIIEYQILKKSEIVIVVSTVEKKRFRKYHNIKDKIVIIRNGFIRKNIQVEKNEDFTLIHSGSFYGTRQPDLFLEGYRDFLNKCKIKDSKVIFIGNIDEGIQEKIKKKGLFKNIEKIGEIEYHESLKLIKEANVLILIEYTNSMTTKIYDYLSTGNPILAITNNKELIKFIQKYAPRYEVVSNKDPNKISKKIKNLYNEWNNIENYDSKKTIIFRNKYSRTIQAKKLVKYIMALD